MHAPGRKEATFQKKSKKRRWRGAGTHEEHHVGVVKLAHDLNFLTEVGQRLFIEVGAVEPFHGHLYPAAFASATGNTQHNRGGARTQNALRTGDEGRERTEERRAKPKDLPEAAAPDLFDALDFVGLYLGRPRVEAPSLPATGPGGGGRAGLLLRGVRPRGATGPRRRLWGGRDGGGGG